MNLINYVSDQRLLFLVPRFKLFCRRRPLLAGSLALKEPNCLSISHFPTKAMISLVCIFWNSTSAEYFCQPVLLNRSNLGLNPD